MPVDAWAAVPRPIVLSEPVCGAFVSQPSATAIAEAIGKAQLDIAWAFEYLRTHPELFDGVTPIVIKVEVTP